MGRGALLISLMVSGLIVSILVKKRMETVPTIVNQVLPAENGEAAPKDLQAVPAHVEKMMKRKIKQRGNDIESQSIDE